MWVKTHVKEWKRVTVLDPRSYQVDVEGEQRRRNRVDLKKQQKQPQYHPWAIGHVKKGFFFNFSSFRGEKMLHEELSGCFTVTHAM